MIGIVSSTENPDAAAVRQAKLERYKFVLSELGRLNENSHRHTKYLLTLFPALSGILLALKFSPNSIGVPAALAPTLVWGVLQLITIASIFAMVSVVSDVASWLDYRREEVILVSSMGGNFRGTPRISNFWRWYETYLVIFIAVYLVFSWTFYFRLF